MSHLHVCTSLLRGVEPVASVLGSESGRGKARCMHQRSTLILDPEELLDMC